jgi:ATP-dependent DNA helicase RecQ
VFRHERPVTLRKDQTRETRRALRRAAAAALPEPAASLFEALRTERARLAKQQGVPPYVIFHDSTLREMAMARPRSVAELSEIPGVGEAKLQRYGGALLKVIGAAAERL